MAIFNTVYGGEGKWKPGANTIAYYPFKSDLNDYTGSNPRSITRGSATYSNNMVSINTIRHSGNIFTGTGDFTILAYMSFGDSKFEANFWSDDNYWDPRCRIGYNDGALWDTDGNWYIINSQVTTNTVYLRVLVRSGTTLYLYTNGVLSGSTTIPTINITGGLGCYIGGHYNTNTSGKIGNLIIEDKARTAEEVSNYYNQTKSKYGL